jgi:hypothetical protein
MTASTCNRSFIRRSSHPLTPFFGGPTHREWRARNRGGVTRPLFNRVHDAAVRDVQCTHDDVSNTACNSVNCSNVSESRNANPSPLSPLRKSVYDSPDIGERSQRFALRGRPGALSCLRPTSPFIPPVKAVTDTPRPCPTCRAQNTARCVDSLLTQIYICHDCHQTFTIQQKPQKPPASSRPSVSDPSV